MPATLSIHEILSRYAPESWGRGEDWEQHAKRLWHEEKAYMGKMRQAMRRAGGWIGEPEAVRVDDGVVQDGHHRIVIAWGLGLSDLEVQVEPTGETGGAL